MKGFKWFSLLISVIYICSLFGNWKGVDASVDLQRGIDITVLYPVFIAGLVLIFLGTFKKGAGMASIVGAAILMIGEIAYLLDWSHVFPGFNFAYSVRYMHAGAIISFVCAAILLIIAVMQQKKTKNETVLRRS